MYNIFICPTMKVADADSSMVEYSHVPPPRDPPHRTHVSLLFLLNKKIPLTNIICVMTRSAVPETQGLAQGLGPKKAQSQSQSQGEICLRRTSERGAGQGAAPPP